MRGSREAQAQVGRCENGGDLVNGLSPIKFGIVHEQSPWTTHNGLRFAVEALSGGMLTRIVSASVNYIREECGKCPVTRDLVYDVPRLAPGARFSAPT